MRPEQSKTVDKMKSVLAEWDAALKHYQAAGKAHAKHNKTKTNKSLAAGKQARA